MTPNNKRILGQLKDYLGFFKKYVELAEVKGEITPQEGNQIIDEMQKIKFEGLQSIETFNEKILMIKLFNFPRFQPDEAGIVGRAVKQFFDLFVKGLTPNQIAEILYFEIEFEPSRKDSPKKSIEELNQTIENIKKAFHLQVPTFDPENWPDRKEI